MTATMTEQVVDAAVLTALDFDTPPVEVISGVVDNKVVYTMPPGSVLTISADSVTWSVAEGEAKFSMLADAPPVTWEPKFATLQCTCPLCLRHSGPMDPTAKALWVKGLRDGSRKQGRGALKQGDLWCALGVLIDVAIQHGVRLRQGVDASGNTLFDGNGGALPTSVMQWAGLRGDPRIEGQPVSFLNDAGMSFEMIADKIEASNL